MVLRNDPDNYTRTCLAIASTETLTDALPGITVPALVVSGGADDRTLPEAGRELAERLGNATFVETRGRGPYDAARGTRGGGRGDRRLPRLERPGRSGQGLTSGADARRSSG